MKNKFLKASVLMLLVLVVFGCKSVYANVEDKKGPTCTMGLSTKLGIGKTMYGYVLCYDDSDLGDTIIKPEDFSINSKLFGRAKILNVSKGYQTSFNPKYYRWDFQVKGTFFGEVNIYLKPGVISDINGNRNYSSTTTVMRVSLF